jgi:hypothetical protein
MDYFQTIFELVKGGLSLNPEAFKLAYMYPWSAPGILFWIVFIAGVSMLLGQCVTLFANRVSLVGFWVSILLGALKFSLETTILMCTTWAAAEIIGREHWEFLPVARAVALTFAPYWLSFLFFIPYLGLMLPRAIKIYVFVALVVALRAVFQVSFIGALLSSFLVVAISQLVAAGLGRLLTPLSDRITSRLIGEFHVKDSREILQLFVRQKPIVREN